MSDNNEPDDDSEDLSSKEIDAILVDCIQRIDIGKNGEKGREQLMQARREAGLEEIGRPPEVQLPNIPACDGCGNDYSGKLRCSRCECSFYCSKDCQKAAWKQGHKHECSSAKERAQKVAKSVVDCLNEIDNLPPVARVQGLTKNLDASGPYMFAVEYGLLDSIRGCFIEDANVVQNNLHPNDMFHVCFTHWIMMCLFRGQRVSRTNSSFGRVDGGRIQAYLQAFPNDGFEVWWHASLQTASLILEDGFQGHELFAHHQTARDVWSGFALTFASKRASEAILLTHDPAKCRARATWMLTELQPYLTKLSKAPEGRDYNDIIEGYFNQVSAMIVAQCRILRNIDINAPKLLKLKKLRLVMYRRIAVPLAEELIRKKKLSDNSRAEVVLKKANAM
jgi:hypothetical protein